MNHDPVQKGGILIQKDVNGTICYVITFDPLFGPPEFEGTMDALMDAVELHHRKAADYDGMESEFGIKGELLGISRKYRKLKKILWDGKSPLFEDAQEMTMDLIGNAALMLRMLKKNSDKYSSRWRDNHGSKPTFGPGPHPSGRQSWLDEPAGHKHVYGGLPARCEVCGEAPMEPNWAERSGG